MPRDQFRHDDLIDPAARETASEYVRRLTDGLGDMSALRPLLMALASTFKGLCDANDLDATAAFEQIVDTLN